MSTATEPPALPSLHWLSDRAPAFVPRAMLVLAHPDDETVGAASILPRLSLANFVYVTDGAPHRLDDARRAGCASREQYAARRWGELLSALESIGIGSDRVEMVGLPDQAASHQLPALVRWLEVLLCEHRPDVVLTHPYEGGHPDHDATAFAVHQACRRLERTVGWAPIIVEFASYHASDDGNWIWGEFLPASATAAPVIARPLGTADRALKRRLLGCYASQQAVLRHVPLDFERFRVAPDYDFLLPPHAGTPLYERFRWGITGREWRERARSALAELFGGSTARSTQPAGAVGDPVASASARPEALSL